MHIILPHDHFLPTHLAAVKAKMAILGAPVIKAVWDEAFGAWVALEGAHRLRAAADLGLRPLIDEVAWSDTLTTDDVVPDSYDDSWTIEEICDGAYRREMITFEDAE